MKRLLLLLLITCSCKVNNQYKEHVYRSNLVYYHEVNIQRKEIHYWYFSRDTVRLDEHIFIVCGSHSTNPYVHSYTLSNPEGENCPINMKLDIGRDQIICSVQKLIEQEDQSIKYRLVDVMVAQKLEKLEK